MQSFGQNTTIHCKMIICFLFDSLECLQIPTAQFSFLHSFQSPSFPRAWSNNALISEGLIPQDKPSAQDLKM